MKNKSFMYFFLLLAMVNISATPTMQVNSLDAQESDVLIEHMADGTSLITFDQAQKDGFKFTIPSGWYPLKTHPTSEELNEFEKKLKESNFSGEINTEAFTSSPPPPPDGFEIVLFELNPEHYQDNYFITVLIGNLPVLPESTPYLPILVILKSLEYYYPDEVTKTETKKIDNQLIGIVEYTFPWEEGGFITGKMLLFPRNGKLFVIAGATNNNERVSDASGITDSILTTLDFSLEE